MTSQRAPVEKPGITGSSPGDPAMVNVYHQYVDDVFYEAGDSWAPASRPHKLTDTHTPTSKDEGLFQNVYDLTGISGIGFELASSCSNCV